MDTTKKTSENRKAKEATVLGLSEKVKRAKALVFANYQGMTHKQLEGLKKMLKTHEAELVVAKNTLLKRSLDENKLAASTELSGPTLALFAYNDVVLPLKELAKTIKLLSLPLLKFGFFEGKQIEEKDILRLATLPSKEILLAQLVGGLKSPIFGLHRSLSWNLQKFVMTLSAIEKKKS